jgi:hypothetical protein
MSNSKGPVGSVARPAIADGIRASRWLGTRLSRGDDRMQSIAFMPGEWRESRFRVRLYRFMANAIPLVSSVIWTWSRMAAAPGQFKFYREETSEENSQASEAVRQLFQRINQSNLGHTGSQDDLLHPFFQSLFLDGAVAGFLELHPDLSGVADFRFFDLAECEVTMADTGTITVTRSTERGERRFTGPDLFYYALNADLANPYGRSILKAVPFVSYVEQQLVDDMRLTQHNAGYHRLHVKIKPPERREGETDESYVSRANAYFDGTVSMIKDIELDDNPVTWDDVAIEYIGPQHQGGTKVSNWYLNHRAMVEEICAGTQLAPFLLGYSYNTTTNWAQFKYDLVMRQVRSVQNAVIYFLEWLANVELSLKGFGVTARWHFDNSVSALAGEEADVRSKEAACVIDLYQAGLIDKETAVQRAARLL